MQVTIVLPISRKEHLLQVFASLENLECDRERTGLLVYVDGEPELYLTVRNLVEQSKFSERLCVQGNIPGQRKEFSINTRRRRIAAIHNDMRKLIKPCEYVLLVEDDGVLGANTLSRLLSDYQAHPYAGFIEGVELGRWGIAHAGAWRADDVYDMKRLESAMPGSTIRTATLEEVSLMPGGGIELELSQVERQHEPVEEIDAGGLYASLTKFEHYARHEFQPFEGAAFGPDVNFGLSLRRQGYRNYIDWQVNVEHCRPDGTSIYPRSTNPVQMRFVRQAGAWSGEVIEG